jgi:hypothetical protein
MIKDFGFLKRLAVIAALVIGASSLNLQGVWAKNFAVPDKNPAVTLSIPDSWKIEEIEFGYSATSPGKDVFFSVEFASAGKVDTMMKNNEKWMKENAIKMVTPKKVEAPINGIPATIFQFETTDGNGQTTLEFIMFSGGNNRMVMLTIWGSDAERTKHGKDIDAIMTSLKPIN